MVVPVERSGKISESGLNSRNLCCRFVEVFHPVGFGHDRNAFFGHREAARTILLRIVADHRARRNRNSLVDDRAANVGVPADIDSFEQN